ncbi:Solute carrier family 35 member G1 [Halotydeus destructor]|nr:Solute carrier family 35 member G1 [Halotydeus destructor]
MSPDLNGNVQSHGQEGQQDEPVTEGPKKPTDPSIQNGAVNPGYQETETEGQVPVSVTTAVTKPRRSVHISDTIMEDEDMMSDSSHLKMAAKNFPVDECEEFQDDRAQLATHSDKQPEKKMSDHEVNIDLSLVSPGKDTFRRVSSGGLKSSLKLPNPERDRARASEIRRRSSIVEVIVHKAASYRGILYAMLSSVFFTLTAAIVKYLKDVHPGQTACFRFLGILLFTMPLVIQAGVDPRGPKDKRLFLIMRGLAGASSVYLRYSALHYLPIANATIIVLSMPVFVCIFARIFLKEACGLFHVVAIGITLVGIGFTSKVNVLVGITSSLGVDKEKEMMGLVYSMAATLVGSSAYILVRKVKEVHHSVILLYFAFVAIIETSIITAVMDGFTFPDCGYAPWFLITLAVLSFYAQLLLTKALQIEEASLVSVTRSSMEVVCAFIFQIIFFKKVPEWSAFIGALLVSSSVLLTTCPKVGLLAARGPLGQALPLVHHQVTSCSILF